MVKWIEGLKVSQTNPAGMAVTITAGVIEADGNRIAVEGIERLLLTPSRQLALREQFYTLEREGKTSPCGWNWSGRRGSNFKPYQLRVPGSLRVYGVDRQTEYVPDEDYVYDDYWGSVMVKPGGRLKVNETVLLDYDVYTCRYDLIYADASGRIGAQEGEWRYGDETNLLLPDSPQPPGHATALASIFIPWGAAAVHERKCIIEYSDSKGQWKNAEGFAWDSRHIDYQPRTYEVKIGGRDDDIHDDDIHGSGSNTHDNGNQVVDVRTAFCAYGRAEGQSLIQPVLENGEVDLPVAREDGPPVFWQVRLPWRRLLAEYPELTCAKVHTFPANVMDLRGMDLTLEGIIKQVTIEENHAIGIEWLTSLANKKDIHLCFHGESTTYGGDWPLLITKQLHQLFPDKRIYSSNSADGGHSSVHGITHVKRTQSILIEQSYDIIFIDYLINDTGCSSEDIYVAMTGIVDWVREHNPQAVIVIIALNGGNPMFIPAYNPANFQRVYDIHRKVAEACGVVFIGMYDYFRHLDRWGIYCLTELKENMINHPYSDTRIDGTLWDQRVAAVFIRWLTDRLSEMGISLGI
ncbi:SGNH/GDSL hydrolase family protein [Paenibacillus eucommiae]|uniref:SGNH hydrolase-type esterase domain-containing protein n=1 Tax=Paenibacillus eucommiae TaxID=1355755 RepID=A0ABS4IVV0_9BACL|nr:SGNH/GDSL hydrolase family protein [Paenibacillus eucommiae]MBP1991717.1 hypothetical protein [Paenibacillus eucommiae]